MTSMKIVVFTFYVLGLLKAGTAVCLEHKRIFSTELRGYITDGSANYKSNQRCEWLIQSPNKTSFPFISLQFTPNTTECGYDFIFVHDGNSDKDPILASLSGNLRASMQGKKIVARSGEMLVRFISDKNTEYDGFNASFSIDQCLNNCSGRGNCQDHTCDCLSGWAGDDCSQSVCLRNCGNYGTCRNDTKNKKCYCLAGFIGKECDVNVNGGQHDNWWSVVYDYSDEHGSEGRAGHAGCYIEPYYYIFGGYDLTKPLSQLLRYNFEKNEWLLLESSTQPAARFYHTVSAIVFEGGPHLFLFGGQYENEELSKETWLYDTVGETWKKYLPTESPNSPLAVCQHAAAVVNRHNENFVYIYGGRSSKSQDFGLSADLFRFDIKQNIWEKLWYNKNGLSSYKLQTCGHSMVYDSIGDSLVVFGGYRINDDRNASLSNSILLYSLTYNRWTELQPSYNSRSYSIEPLGFHTANIVGDYMIIHGGKKNHHAENRCFSRHTHFYHLRSHSWIRTLSSEAVSSPMKLFGHTADIINDKILLVHGGYFGVMSNVLRAYTLPNLVKNQQDNCRINRNRDSCQSDVLMGCTWAENRCVRNENLESTYGSVCSSLKDCISCTTHHSYQWNATDSWEAQSCAWCVQDGACYSQSEKGISSCGVIKRIQDGTSWWMKNQSLLLQDPNRCFADDMRPGVVVTEYDGLQDFSRPDNATLLNKVAIKWKSSGAVGRKYVRIRGFLKVHQTNKKFMHMQLGAVKGAATISLSSTSSPVDKKVIATLRQTAGYAKVKTSPISTMHFQPKGCYFEVTFNHLTNTRWSGKVEVAVGFSDLVTDTVEFRPLTYTHLQQYQSSIAFESSQAQHCRAMTNCLSCLSDASCGWCYSQSKCIERSAITIEGKQCDTSAHGIKQPLGRVIIDLQFCERCTDLMTCNKCVDDVNCGWDKTTGMCMRRRRKNYLVTEESSCPTLCSEFNTCESCMASTSNDGTSTGCTWCVTNQMCYRPSRHHLPAYTFGECAFWVDTLEQCPICSRNSDCKSCLMTYGCGWCGGINNPLLGYCSKGGFLNPRTTCDSKFLPNVSHGIHDLLWSYSSCPDVDECLVGEWPEGNRLNMCHENATCINTDGSYECSCNKGFEGSGRQCVKSCLTDCRNGHCSGPPNFVCICDLGWTSKDYDDGYACDVDCHCNFLSSCSSGPGICDSCQLNSDGPHCSRCQNGYYHSIQSQEGCLQCECNNHGDASRGFCDQNTGVCFCQDHTHGRNCEYCMKGYYGDPTNGGACYRKCGGRLELSDAHGFLGSWEASINMGSLLPLQQKNVTVHCEWIITAENPALIKIILDRSLFVPCYVNQVLVFDGKPNSGDFDLIGEFCGRNWRYDVTLYTVSGSATIRFQIEFPIGRQDLYGFSAKYEIISTCSAVGFNSNGSVIDNKESPSNLNMSEVCPTWEMSPCVLDKLIESQSIGKALHRNASSAKECIVPEQSLIQIEWTQSSTSTKFPPPNIGSVAAGLDGCLWIHGGVGSKGSYGNLWKYNVSSKEWFEEDRLFHPSPRYFHAVAASSNMNTIFIHGGVLEDLTTSDELWEFSPKHGWVQHRNHWLPSLARHTMTSCDDRKFVVIGGYDSETGYSSKVWNFDTVDVIATEQSVDGYIPMIYDHSSVCDTKFWHVYIIGGIQNINSYNPEYNDILYRLDTLTWTVHPILKMPGFMHQPALHSAFHLSQVISSGIVAFVGDASLGNVSADMWFYHYATQTWSVVSSENSDSNINIPLSSSVAVIDGNHYLFGGVKNGRPTNTLLVVPNFNPCLLTEKNSTCASSHEACKQFYSKCGIPMESVGYKLREYKPPCSNYRDCESCLDRKRNFNSSCRWCEHIRTGKMSKCIPTDSNCDDISVEKGCNPCAGLLFRNCYKDESCIWTASQDLFNPYFTRRNRNRGCQCYQRALRFPIKWRDTYAGSIIPCPESCRVFNTCESCLQNRFDGTQHHCSWIDSKEICVNTQYLPLVCPIGGDCKGISDGEIRSCSVQACEDMRFCMECLQTPDCFWSDQQQNGGCRNIHDTQHLNKTTLKWYLKCPPQDECAEGWDNCETRYNEKCQDLDQGYQCVCQDNHTRTSLSEPCKPVCLDGCNNGICVRPGQCQCDFGYMGRDCSIKCNCNGNSGCKMENGEQKCTRCYNNTIGEHCEFCAPGYVGDPTRMISCRECKVVCNRKSDICVSKDRDLHDHGPTEREVKCLNCDNNSWGDRCERCQTGYFKLRNICKKCQCNGHSDVCAEGSLGLCKCENHTTSSDPRCNDIQQENLMPNDCWTKQCDKCEPFYTGNPVNGGLCYRQIFQDQIVCFKSDQSLGCPSKMDLESWSIFKQSILDAGRTIQYSVTPRVKNLDIVLTLDVAFGKVTLFLSNEMDYFQINSKITSMNHEVTTRYDSDTSRSKRDLSQRVKTSRTENTSSPPAMVGAHQYIRIDASSNGSPVVKFKPNTALQISDIQNRLVVIIPHTKFDMQRERFFLILLSQENSEFLWNTSGRYPFQEKYLIERLSGSVAGLMFRQDQTNMDLFVFFSFFFSCFLLILGIGNIVIKIRGIVNARRVHREHDIRMKHMAKRPFATVNILLNQRRRVAAKNVLKKERCKLKLNVSTWIEGTADENSLNSFFPSSLNVSTRIFCERPVTVYHQESGDLPLLNSTAKYTEHKSDERGEGPSTSKIASTFKRVRFKQTSTFDGILKRGNSIRTKGSVSIAGNSGMLQEPSIIACEALKSGLSVSTVLLQLPGPKRTQVVLCLGSSLLLSQNS